MTACLRQGDYPHDVLGEGPATFASAGCLLFCLDNARHRLTGAPLDPRGLNALGLKGGLDHNAFNHSAAYIARLAELGGMHASDRVEGSVDVMAKAIAGYLASGRLVLAHVDHDSTKPKGDLAADHWVLIHALAGLTVAYDDPATGEQGGLSSIALCAPSGWRDHRPYVVRAFRTLRKA